MIKLENVSKSFGAFSAVQELSFEVKQGSITAFLGPNGAGKTTTMRLITTYLRPDSGKITVAGFDSGKQAGSVRQSIGYMPENGPLYQDMTVIEYLETIAKFRALKDKKSAIRKVLIDCDLKSVVKQSIRTLSKGFQQRVGLAGALVHNPDVLVLDEPTTGLDPNQVRQIKELIQGLSKTLLLSTHNLDQIQDLCDWVLLLNKGSLVTQGTPQELRNRNGVPQRALIDCNVEPSTFAQLIEHLPCAVETEQQINQHYHYGLSGTFDRGLLAKLSQSISGTHELYALTPIQSNLDDIFAQLTQGEA